MGGGSTASSIQVFPDNRLLPSSPPQVQWVTLPRVLAWYFLLLCRLISDGPTHVLRIGDANNKVLQGALEYICIALCAVLYVLYCIILLQIATSDLGD